MKLLEAIRKPHTILLLSIGLIALLLLGVLVWRSGLFPRGGGDFNGENAYAHVLTQVAFGPRITGTTPNIKTGDYISEQLHSAGWQVEFQPFTYRDTAARNIIARANVGRGPIFILGAHYDTRKHADQDSAHPTDPVPGANDGASGAAVLLELARSLDLTASPHEIWLTFFDAEDNGNIEDWEWIIGSQYMADHLGEVQPEGMILVDMVGDTDQQFYFDTNSDPALSARVWTVAAGLGYGEHFFPVPRWTMTDDHIPFKERGIPAIDIIDFDYPDWHKTTDTADKVSAASLERVGRTLEYFLEVP